MNFLKIFLIISLSIILTSCSNSVVVKIDKDKRIITREYKNGKVKIINQKFNSMYQQWLDVKCTSKETDFSKCEDDKIIYTKLAILKIREIQKDHNSSNNEEQYSGNKEQSSSNEEQSSANEEDNTSEDDDISEQNDDAPVDNNPPIDGHPPIDGYPPLN